MDLNFAVHKLEMFSSNPGRVHFEVLVQLLRYIRDNKTLGLKHYSDIKDAPLSNLLRQDSIKTENQLMALSDYSLQDFPDTGIITGAYVIFYQGGPIYHGRNVPVSVAKSSAES